MVWYAVLELGRITTARPGLTIESGLESPIGCPEIPCGQHLIPSVGPGMAVEIECFGEKFLSDVDVFHGIRCGFVCGWYRLKRRVIAVLLEILLFFPIVLLATPNCLLLGLPYADKPAALINLEAFRGKFVIRVSWRLVHGSRCGSRGCPYQLRFSNASIRFMANLNALFRLSTERLFWSI